jgi:hypothetical protein
MRREYFFLGRRLSQVLPFPPRSRQIGHALQPHLHLLRHSARVPVYTPTRTLAFLGRSQWTKYASTLAFAILFPGRLPAQPVRTSTEAHHPAGINACRVTLKYWTQLHAIIMLFIAAVLALLAWQAPLALELQSRARWLADAQRARSMMHKQDVGDWPSLQPDAQLTAFWVYSDTPEMPFYSPIAVSQRQRDELVFGSLITGWPSLPAGTPVGVNTRGVVHSIDPRTNMLALFGLGVFRVWVLLVTSVVVLPWVICRLWAWWMYRIHRLVVTPTCVVPAWAVVAAASASALVLSWGFFDRKYLWGRSAPNWQEATIIAGAVFGSLILPRLVRGLFDARDRAAAQSQRCRACFYGPFGSSDTAGASTPILAHPRRCPECGTDAAHPHPADGRWWQRPGSPGSHQSRS